MYHLHVRRHSKGLLPVANRVHEYICREGRYSMRGDVVRVMGSVHMPAWTHGSAGAYWYALDKLHSRANARLLYTVVVAIPRALPVRMQNDLVARFAELLARTSTGLGGRKGVPVSYAIHEGVKRDAATAGRRPNPHAHFMASTSISDDVDRSLALWFCRANKARPLAGGAPRSKVIGGRRWLMRVRRGWAKLANAALRTAGLSERVDHRSHRARGLAALPTAHLGPHIAASVGAGKPHPVAARNARVKKFNADLAAGEERIRRLAAKQRALEDAEGAALVLRNSARAAAVIELLQQHPFAQDRATLIERAPLLLYSDGSTRRQGFQGDSSELVKRLMRTLPSGGTVVPDHDRIWVLRDNASCIALVGLDFVASDSAGPEVGGWVVQIASALGLNSVVAHVQTDSPALRQELDAAMLMKGMYYQWQLASEVGERQNRNYRR